MKSWEKGLINEFNSVSIDKNKILSPIYAANYSFKHSKKKYRRNLQILTYMLALVILVGGISGYMVAEAKEFNEAASFFTDNDLDKDGLSRNEIKKVYLDISSGKFEYGKTKEVINKNTHEIEVKDYEALDAGTLKELWNMRNLHSVLESTKKGVEYSYNSNVNEELERIDYYLRKSNDNQPEWEIYLGNEFNFHESLIYQYNDDAIIVGTKFIDDVLYEKILYINKSGHIEWEDIYSGHATNLLYVYNEEIHMVGRSTGKEDWRIDYINLKSYDLKGINLFQKKIEYCYLSKINAASNIGEDYILQFNAGYGEDNKDILARLNKNGDIITEYKLELDGKDYNLRSIVENNGKIYISLDMYTETTDEFSENCITYLFRELRGITDDMTSLNDAFTKEVKLEINELKEYTQQYREEITAVLLICDYDLEILDIQMREGTGAGKLNIQDSKVVWKTQRIEIWNPTHYRDAGIVVTNYEEIFNKNGKHNTSINKGLEAIDSVKLIK